jgi:hypothetical protein
VAVGPEGAVDHILPRDPKQAEVSAGNGGRSAPVHVAREEFPLGLLDSLMQGGQNRDEQGFVNHL